MALTLVAASYDTGTSVTLVFDRAVAIGGINVGVVLVNDEFTNETYAGSGAVLVAPDAVQLSLTPVGAAS